MMYRSGLRNCTGSRGNRGQEEAEAELSSLNHRMQLVEEDLKGAQEHLDAALQKQRN